MSPPAPVTQASGRQIARGAAWLMLFKMLDKSIGLISTLILARLLVPADFGLVAMATAVVALTHLLSAFGFDSALIQRRDATRAHFDTAWTFNVAFGVAIAALLASLAVPIAAFYSDERLRDVLLVLACGALAGGFENIGTVAFRRELDFRSEFRFLLLKRIASFAVTIALALWLRSYWALVAGTVTGRVLAVWISYRLHPFRPRLTLSARADLLHFSKWILISSALQFMQTRSIDFVLGRTVGPHGVGLYAIASEVAYMPSTELIAPLNRAVFPAYASLSGDIVLLRERFLEVLGIICLIGFPISAALFGVADPAIRVVLGDKWLEAIPLLKIFCVCGLIGALQSNLYLLIVALGKPQANTLVSAVLLAFSLPLTVWASLQFGLLGAAWAQMAAAFVGLAGIVFVFRRLTGIGLRALSGVAWRPALNGAALVGGLQALDAAMAAQLPQPLRLAALLTCAVALAPGLALALWSLSGKPKSAENAVLRLLADKLHFGRRAAA